MRWRCALTECTRETTCNVAHGAKVTNMNSGCVTCGYSLLCLGISSSVTGVKSCNVCKRLYFFVGNSGIEFFISKNCVMVKKIREVRVEPDPSFVCKLCAKKRR